MEKRSSNVVRILCSTALTFALVPAAAWAESAPDSPEGIPDASTASALDVPQTDTSSLRDVDARAAQAVEGYFVARAEEVRGDGSASDTPSLDLSDDVAQVSDKRAEGFADVARDANLVVLDASTSVQVGDVEERADGTVEVDAYETTVFTYDDLSDGAGGSDVAMFGTSHTLELAADGGAVQVVEDRFDESDIVGIDTTGQSAAVRKAVVSGAAAKTAAVPVYDAGYNAHAAIAYADKYWNKYNTASYSNYNDVGGDCANFVSQCLNAGGMTQRKGSWDSSDAWWYTSRNNVSGSWVNCEYMVKYFKKRGSYVKNPKPEQIYPGSIVMYATSGTSWCHATFCTGYNSAGTPVISAHNNNRYHVPYTYWSNTTKCAIRLTEVNPYRAVFATSAASTAAKVATAASEDAGSVLSAKTPYAWRVVGDGKVSLESYAGTERDVAIGTSVKDASGKVYAVTGIGDRAFYANKTLTSVSTGDSVVSIGTSAFSKCTRLASLSLGAHVSTLGAYSFYKCTSLAQVAGANAVATLGNHAFRKCTSLAALPAFGSLSVVGAYAFNDCDTLKAIAGLPAVTSLGKGAFYGCDRLVSASVSSKRLTSVGTALFRDCPKLKTADFASKKVVKLATRMFYHCTALKTVTFSSTKMTSVGNSAFLGCRKLKTVTLASKKITTISDYAFCDCAKLARLVVPSKKVKKVGFRSFWNVYKKAKVHVPSTKKAKYRALFTLHGLSTKASFKAL